MRVNVFIRCTTLYCREIQAQEALQNGQLGSGEGIPDLQPGVLASQAMIEKTLTEDPRWQGELPPPTVSIISPVNVW